MADGGTVPYPSLTKDMHHEVELVVALKSGGRNIPVAKANDCIYGYAVGIDLTRRDLQIASRDLKRPWEIGKAFDHSAPCGALKPASETGHPTKGKITLKCNGTLRQDGDLNQLIWNVPEIISNLSEMVALVPGDIIMTGTPVGRRRDGGRRQARMRGRGRRHAHGDHRSAAEIAAHGYPFEKAGRRMEPPAALRCWALRGRLTWINELLMAAPQIVPAGPRTAILSRRNDEYGPDFSVPTTAFSQLSPIRQPWPSR